MVKFKKAVKRKSFGDFFAPISRGFSFLKKKFSFLRFLDPFTYVDLFVIPKIRTKFGEDSLVEKATNVFFALLFAFLAYTILGIVFQTSSPMVIVYSASMEPSFFRGDVMFLGKPAQNDSFGPVIFVDYDVAKKGVSEFFYPTYDAEGRFVSFSVGGQDFNYAKTASVVVYSAYNPLTQYNGKPIIHRSIAKIVAPDGNFILTKGDNDSKKFFSEYFGQYIYSNPTFDQDCGSIVPVYEKPSKGCITLYPVKMDSLQGRAFFRIPLVGCVKLWLVDDLTSLLLTGKLPPDFKGIC
jgi:signal peptidase I